MNLNPTKTPTTSSHQPITSDPRVKLWQDLLRRHIQEIRASGGTAMRFIYADELQRETGHMIPDGGYQLVQAALRPFAGDRDFEVYQHTTNRYDDEKPGDRYFCIAYRHLPSSISRG